MLVFRYLAALAALPVFAANTLPQGNLTIHEWGTFTTVAGPQGGPVSWLPLSGPPDLPCFVHRLGTPNPKFSMTATVRMETPVVYFYAPRPVTLNLRVDFPGGLITEWYPNASRISPSVLNFGNTDGTIEWQNIQIGGDGGDFPTGKGPSRYYAARATDSVPVRAGDEREKLIFYRGAGNFEVPMAVLVTSEGRLQIRNTVDGLLPFVIAFENRGGRMGYRVIPALGAQQTVTVDAPIPQGDVREALRRELGGALQSAGLFRKEADAMLATWGDSWFEEGMRIIYLTPRATVDQVLPLEVKPAAQQTERVFVGRAEVLSPGMRQTIEASLASGDRTTLAKYGRFLPNFVDRIKKEHGGTLVASPDATEFLQAQRAEGIQAFTAPACVQ